MKPLYDSLHCYVRGQLQKTYGAEQGAGGKPIPAHLLGNMWAQQWAQSIRLVEPYPGASISTSRSRAEEAEIRRRCASRSRRRTSTSRSACPTLPQTFWERSMLTQPRDRDVRVPRQRVAHGRQGRRAHQDVHRADEEDLFTIYHELGHVYYYLSYKDQPYLFQGGAHDGFHEAIGDTISCR